MHKNFINKSNIKKALELFKNQAAWTAFCISNNDSYKSKLTEEDIDIAYNNVGLTYSKLGKPLWANAWFNINPKSKLSHFNLSKLSKIKSHTSPEGTYVSYAGFGEWDYIIVKKRSKNYQIRFNGSYMGARSLIYGPNMGEFDTSMPLNSHTAHYKTNHCKIDLDFTSNSLKHNVIDVNQNGSDADCGFGMNVNAGGTYYRVENH